MKKNKTLFINPDAPEAIVIPPVISIEKLAPLLGIQLKPHVHPVVEKMSKFFVTKILWKVQAWRGTPITK